MSLFQHQNKISQNKGPYVVRLWNRFLRWMQYDPPSALDAEHWSLFEDEFKEKAPIRNFLVNTIPNFVAPISYYYRECKHWVLYRTVNRYHVIDTGLKPGYYEISDKVLHGNFNLLKEFVEKEQAWATQCWSSDKKLKWFETLPLYYQFVYRKPEIGIAHYNWAATLDDPLLPPGQQSIEQAKSARIILALYIWWTVTRPERYTMEDKISYNNQGYSMGPLDSRFDATAADYVAYQKWHDEYDKREKEWEEEDEQMLCQLIKIRHSLWT